jgi:RNA polymerase sigma factor (sigma-70 family)
MSTCFALPVSPRPSLASVDHPPPVRGPDEVLRRFREGDRVVLEGVYRTYVGPVTTVVRSSLRSRRGHRSCVDHASMDLVQEVFLRAFAPCARRSFDGARAYGPYLYTVARNVVIDWKRKAHREVPTDSTDLERLADSGKECPGDDGDDRYLGAVLARYLDELDPALRAVLDVRYRRGLSQMEGARAIGLSRQSLRTLEARLQAGLRRALKAHAIGST